MVEIMEKNKSISDEVLPYMKILVVDDEPALRDLLRLYLENLGQQVVVAENGEDAIRQFELEAPDLVIMDVLMPGMDGYEATRRIKEISGTRWVPIILSSSLSTPEEQIKGLDMGGDDYLLKPVNYAILSSKIRAMQRIAAMQTALADSLGKLEQYKSKTEEELILAQHIMRKLTRADMLSDVGIKQLNLPAGAFSGDVVAAARTPGDVKYILLADVTGHGLSSALSSMPLVDIFYELTERGMQAEELCRQMNLKLKRVLPAGYFVAAALAVIDPRDKTIRIWNGGLPSAMFMIQSGEIIKTWKSRHMALGILGDKDFDDSMEVMHSDVPGQLLMFTDGLTEAASAEGEEFGMERLLACLAGADEKNRVEHVHAQLLEFLSGVPAHDDVSLISVRCP